MECRAVNQVGVAITDKIVNISCEFILLFQFKNIHPTFLIDPPLNVVITGSQNLLQNETEKFTCSVAESNPAVSLSWFVSVDNTLLLLPEAYIETVTEPSGYGWTGVSRAIVTATQDDILELVCLAQIESLGFSREANHRVDIHSKTDY